MSTWLYPTNATTDTPITPGVRAPPNPANTSETPPNPDRHITSIHQNPENMKDRLRGQIGRSIHYNTNIGDSRYAQ